MRILSLLLGLIFIASCNKESNLPVSQVEGVAEIDTIMMDTVNVSSEIDTSSQVDTTDVSEEPINNITDQNYLKVTINGEEWEPHFAVMIEDEKNEVFTIAFQIFNQYNELRQELAWFIPFQTVLEDSIQFYSSAHINIEEGRGSLDISRPSFAYCYADGDVCGISYEVSETLSFSNYFIIDSLARDSSFIRGRFEVLLHRMELPDPNGIEPDSLYFKDGEFRLELGEWW